MKPQMYQNFLFPTLGDSYLSDKTPIRGVVRASVIYPQSIAILKKINEVQEFLKWLPCIFSRVAFVDDLDLHEEVEKECEALCSYEVV